MESTQSDSSGNSRAALLAVRCESASRGRRLAILVASSGRDPAELVFDLRDAPREHLLPRFVNSLLSTYFVVGAYPADRFGAAEWLTSDPFEAELIHRQIALAVPFLPAEPSRFRATPGARPLEGELPERASGDTELRTPPTAT